MADNLESYFKKHLSDDNPDKENWNVPSDDVWNKVLPVIQKKKGLFIPWKYLYIFGALIVIGLAVIFWPTDFNKPSTNNELSSITEGINKSTKLPQSNIETDESLNNENSGRTNQIVNSSFPEKSDLNTYNANIYQDNTTQSDNVNNQSIHSSEADLNINETNVSLESTLTTNELNLKNSRGFSSNSDPVKGLKSNEPDSRLAKQSEILKANMISKNSNEMNNFTYTNRYSYISQQENSQIEKIPSRSIDNLGFTIQIGSLLMNNVTSIVPVTVEKKKEKPGPFDNKGKFGVGASFLPTFTATYITSTMSTGQLETSNMLLHSSNWGLELRYYLSNRFTLVTGIGQSGVRSWSKSQVDFDYDSSNEHIMDTGEKENTSAVPMPTPFGEIGTEITYRFPGEDDIPDGETMQSELETHQEVRYLSIPLGVEYNIIRFSRFSWFAETGIRYNRALKDAASFTSRILHEGHDMDVVGEEMTGHPTYTENYLDLYLGTGINYQFSKSFQISGSARYFNSITNVNFQDNMSTHVRGLNFKIGLVYIF